MVIFTEISLFLPRLPDFLEGMRLLLASDLYTAGYGRNEKILGSIIRQGADLLLFVGDFCRHMVIGNPFGSWQEPCKVGFSAKGLAFPPQSKRALYVTRKLLQNADFPLGIFAVLGNHDPADFVHDLTRLGVTTLDNETRQLTTFKERRFNICGVNCLSRSSMDIAETVLEMDPSLFTIGLCHFPEMAEPLAGAGVDLILAGHTHGGQICLPDGTPLISHSQTGRKYSSGLERLGDNFIYTSRGLGNSIIPVRVNCPPEITRLTLHRGKPDGECHSYKK